jgi:gas vesicle protein
MLACALVVGVLFAVLFGFEAGQSAEGDGASTNASVQLRFAPAPAIFGLLTGALAGLVVGFAWSRPGVVGVVGMLLVAGIGGLAGLVIAAQLGTENRTTITATSVSMEYGASKGVLAAGGAVGVVVGALAAWWFRPRPSGQAGD